MIIEFTGPPNAGKTTIFNELKQYLGEDTQYISSIKTFIVKKYKISILRPRILQNVFFDTTLFYIFLKNINTNKSIFISALNKINKSVNTIFNKANLIRNLIKKLAINNFCKNYEKVDKSIVFLIDEGLVHIVYNIFADTSKKSINKNEVIRFSEKIPLPSKIVMADSEDKNIFFRFQQKHHKRVSVKNQEDILSFISKNRIISEYLKQWLFVKNGKTRVFYFINNKENIKDELPCLLRFIKEDF